MINNEKWVPVAKVKNYQHAYLWSLVLQSVHVPHVLFQQKGDWVITVEEELQAMAVNHIASFEQENRNWPPPKEEPAGFFSFRNRQPRSHRAGFGGGEC